jgi:hypothetical protein
MLARSIDDIGNTIGEIGRQDRSVEDDVLDWLPRDAQSASRDDAQADDAIDLLTKLPISSESPVVLSDGPNEPDSSIDKNRATLRRWSVSAAIVLLLHGAIFVGLVRWHILILPVTLTRPFLVDLTEPPETLGPPPQRQSEPQPAPSVERAAQPNPSERQAVDEAPPGPDHSHDNPEQQVAGEAVTPKKAPPGSNLPELSTAPSRNTEAQSGDVEDAKPSAVGAGEPVVPTGPTMSGPIDIDGPIGGKDLASRLGSRWKKALNTATAPKPVVIARHGRDAGERARDLIVSNPTTNAIGVRVEDHAGTGAVRANGLRVVSVNAIGGSATTNSSPETNTPAGPATNAIGVTVHFRRGIHTRPIGQHTTFPVVVVGAPTGAAAISGTGIGHVGMGMSAIGGPAKTPSGGINGTTFRPRHL